MADLMSIIRERRSVRKFESREVPEDLLETVLDAVRWTPSWANTQCWEIVVVSSMETKERLQATLAKGNPAAKAMVEAPLLLVLCARMKTSGYYKEQVTTKFGDWFMFDLGLAAQSLSLAAHAGGLGTVVVGLFDHDRVKEIVGVPADVEVVALMPLGFPAKIPASAPKRREIGDFTHRERY